MRVNELLITPWAIIISISIIFGLVFSINIFLKDKGNRKANQFLALFLFTLTILLFSNFIVISKLYKIFPQLIGISFLIWYVMPPLFYFYIKTGLAQNYKFAWYDLLHTIPFIYMLIRTIPFYMLSSEVKLQEFEGFITSTKTFSFSSGFIIAYSFAYLAICFFLIYNFEKNYKEDFANTDIEHIDGIKRLVLVYTIYQILDLVGVGAIFLSSQSSIEIMQFISVSLTIFIFVISYTFIRQPQKLFQSQIVKSKYKTSSLSVSDIKIYSQKLDYLMTEKKLYLDSEITLSSLAKYMDTSSHTISQVINQHYKMNFYEFINKFRVNEVKSQLLNPKNKNLTIIAIAYDAGFNSKSSFHKIFKRFVGKTPTDFMKENGIDLS